MFAPFHPGASPFHRAPAGVKLAALAVAGTGLFFITAPAPMLALAALALALYPLAGLPLRAALAQIRPVWLVLALIVGVQLWLEGAPMALLVGARLLALLWLAGLVSLTTRASAMVSVLERGLSVLAPLGVNPRKGALALALAVRFVPLLARIVEEVREAQRVRGLERSLVALAVPVLVRALKLTDELADAIEARSFDSAP